MGLLKETKELHSDPRNIEHTEVGEEMLGFLNKFQEIEEKSKCLRVQFLDWLSDVCLDWSNKLHTASVNIDSPCVIKVEPRKKEDSKSAKESKEIVRLKELIAKAEERADNYYKKNQELTKDLTQKVDKLLKETAE